MTDGATTGAVDEGDRDEADAPGASAPIAGDDADGPDSELSRPNTFLAVSDRPRAPRAPNLERRALSAGEGDGDGEHERLYEAQASWASLRGILANIVFFWRTSLPFRTITISVALTSATVLAVGLIMSNSIANDLFSSRLSEVLAESDRASTQAQTTFASGIETDAVALQTLQEQALAAAMTAAPNSEGYIFFQADPGDSNIQLQDLATNDIDHTIVTDDLREQVRQQQATQYYQSVSLLDSDGEPVPAVVVGTLIEVSTSYYELYFVYSLAEAQRTLDFIQRTLMVSMLVLVLLVGAITGFVMRAVVQPIRLAAQTSRKLAAGHLEERIPESGEDDIATLARSFNDMADSLQEQIERLGHLSQVQQRFVSDVSHELRTPLTTIRLAGQMLFDRRDEFDPLATRSVELLHNQIE
ncbi:MAG: HAMP domain-containing protein [Pseudoclavibacter sp.]